MTWIILREKVHANSYYNMLFLPLILSVTRHAICIFICWLSPCLMEDFIFVLKTFFKKFLNCHLML